MKKLFFGSAIVALVILTAGFASAFETTANDGFIYLYAPGLTTPVEPTLFDSNSGLPIPSFQVTLVDALANPLPGTKYTGQELFSGNIILPIGLVTSGIPAAVTVQISAISHEKGHWVYKGIAPGGALVAGDIYYLGYKVKDKTETPLMKKPAYDVWGTVTGNANFNGSYRAVFYGIE
jgi:hypothetical protein